MRMCEGRSERPRVVFPVQPQNDKEPITAGGKKLDTLIASKSVGGSVVPGEGQKQGV